MQIAASNIFAFIIGLGFLIFAHEAGHFVVAKLFKVRVLVFSLGFLVGAFLADTRNSIYSLILLGLSWPLYLLLRPNAGRPAPAS